jgi:hypothetical protein
MCSLEVYIGSLITQSPVNVHWQTAVAATVCHVTFTHRVVLTPPTTIVLAFECSAPQQNIKVLVRSDDGKGTKYL